MSVVGLSILGMSLVWCRFCGLVGLFCLMMKAVFVVPIDWSAVERDDDGDWRALRGLTPSELAVYNKHISEGEWRDVATFAGAVAAAMAAEDQERRLRNERLHSHVAGRLQVMTPIPNRLAELAIAAVHEFERENPVD